MPTGGGDRCLRRRSPAPRPCRPTCSRPSRPTSGRSWRTTSTCSTRRSRPGDGTMRGDAAGLLVGHDAISAFRGVRGGVPPRVIERIEHRALAPDAALLVSVSRFAGGGTGLQTQLWERIDGRWLITAAHVTPRAQALDRSVWRTVGDPLWQGAWEGPLAGLTVAVKDLFAIKGYRIGAGNPAFLAEARAETTTAAGGDRPAARRSVAARHRPHRRVRVQHRRRQRALRHPAERRAAGRAAGRLLERSGVRRRHRPGRDRPRDRHRRVGAGARLVPGAVGAAHDARPRAAAGPAAARAVLRHGRLAHARRRRRCSGSSTGASATTGRSRPRTCYGESDDDLPWRFVVPDEVLAAVEPDDARRLRRAARAARAHPTDAAAVSSPRRSAISTTTSCRSAPCRAPRRGATTASGCARTRMRVGPAVAERFRIAAEVDRRGRGIRSPRPRAARANACSALVADAVLLMPTVPGPGADAHRTAASASTPCAWRRCA